MSVVAIYGTGGIGKTWLALHWAHRCLEEFPDGQLYVNLRGFDPAGTPLDPAEALRGFLDALGYPPGWIPVDQKAQAALYRKLASGRKILIILDNARDLAQVLPLLPRNKTCRVLITSRNQVFGTNEPEGGCDINLGPFSNQDSFRLLTKYLGSGRIDAESCVAQKIHSDSRGLPLVLAIVGAQASAHGGTSLAAIVDELAKKTSQFDSSDDDLERVVQSVISWAYDNLDDSSARVFRLLGMHPGPDISIAAAASLLGVSRSQAQAVLSELVDVHLMTEHFVGRFTFRDLVKLYAVDRSFAVDTEDERRSALHRVLDHYLHTAYAADRLRGPTRDPLGIAAVQRGVLPAELANIREARQWWEAEHEVLVAAVARAGNAGFHSHAWQLAWTLSTFFDRRGHWRDWVATQEVALDSARRLGNRSVEARALRPIGRAKMLLGSYEESYMHLQQALDLFQQLGDRVGEAHTHHAFTELLDRQGRFAEALSHTQQALELYRAVGHRAGEAIALNSVGWDLAQLGHHDDALAYCQQA
ncbi:tetratricopeptide repeat protein, partial [Saccharopolyspora shandongensis]|uniref:ATP-binding protein n=1 Tax=Saccharopolyspora shandongensis TaxID=418495 RepID=UPI0034347FB2